LFSRTLLWASEKPRVQKLITETRLTRRVVDRFVAGDRLEDAIAVIKELNSKGIGGILDFLGEGVRDAAGANAAATDYLNAIRRIDETKVDTTVSVKLTQLGLSFDKGSCIDHLRVLTAEAQAIGAVVEIDMEQTEYVSDTLDVYRVLQADFPELRLAMQAYLRRTPVDLQMMAAMRPKVRLVKGAYAESESVAFQKRMEIDAQYVWLTDWLFQQGRDPALATHDFKLIQHAKSAAAHAGLPKDSYEIQMLYGVRRDMQEQLAGQGHRVRTYVPYGSAWYPYLMRRIAERPANLVFFLRALARN
jgi:proline dehydrogenase